MINANELIEKISFHCSEMISNHNDIVAILLVGSYARNMQNEKSDIDLVILSDQWKQFFVNKKWLSYFGTPLTINIEYYGLITSLRVKYEQYEIEFGFGSTEWISIPIDTGTKKVLQDGYKILYEGDNSLIQIKECYKPSLS